MEAAPPVLEVRGITKRFPGVIANDNVNLTLHPVATELGIGMVHQLFQLVDVLSVTDNVMLGNESVRGPFLRSDHARRTILAYSEQLNIVNDVVHSDGITWL